MSSLSISLSHTFSLTLIFNHSLPCSRERQAVAVAGTWVQDLGSVGDSEARDCPDTSKHSRWHLGHLTRDACSLLYLATGLWKSPLDLAEGGGLGNPWPPTAPAQKSSPEPAQPPAAGRETRPEMESSGASPRRAGLCGARRRRACAQVSSPARSTPMGCAQRARGPKQENRVCGWSWGGSRTDGGGAGRGVEHCEIGDRGCCLGGNRGHRKRTHVWTLGPQGSMSHPGTQGTTIGVGQGMAGLETLPWEQREARGAIRAGRVEGPPAALGGARVSGHCAPAARGLRAQTAISHLLP